MEQVSDFDRFWNAYPRKLAKGDARKAWQQTADIRPSIDRVLQAIDAARRTDQWRRDGGQFVPYPATWLRAERWDDVHEVEVEPVIEKRPAPAGWWADERKTLEVAAQLGLSSRAGEDWNGFRSRIRAAIERKAA